MLLLLLLLLLSRFWVLPGEAVLFGDIQNHRIVEPRVAPLRAQHTMKLVAMLISVMDCAFQGGDVPRPFI